jgi:Mn-dependent DtxR family transcriptional regulator
LSSWFWAIYRMSHDKKGISAVQLAKEIGVSYPTAWLMLHKIRLVLSAWSATPSSSIWLR